MILHGRVLRVSNGPDPGFPFLKCGLAYKKEIGFWEQFVKSKPVLRRTRLSGRSRLVATVTHSREAMSQFLYGLYHWITKGEGLDFDYLTAIKD